MPYIGNDLATQFQAFTTQTITGDGSTGYTLDRAVANGKEILVYINNVKQEEGSGKSYEASGTTITFSEAVASTDSCYLVYMGSAQQTVTAPAGSIVSGQIANANLELPSTLDMNGNELILDADGDTTITSDTDDRVDIKVAGTDTVHIDASGIGVNVTNPLYPFHTRAASGGDNAALFLEGPNNGYSTIYMGDTDDIDIGSIQYNHSSNYMLFQTNNAEAMRIDSTGAVTKPLQPAFLVFSVDSNNFPINDTRLMTLDTEVFDQNNDVASNVFTAPVTGRYQLSLSLYFQNVVDDAIYLEVYLTTSNRTYYFIIDPEAMLERTSTYHTITASVLADMDASDTASVSYRQSSGTATTDFNGTDSFFSGYLAC